MAKIEINSDKDLGKLKLVLNDWFYSSRICSDNVTIKQERTFDGLLQVISMQLWDVWRKEFSFPVSLYDYIKIKYFPEFFLKRFPARIKKYTFAEVIPMLSKDSDKTLRQLEENDLGHFESVVRKPIENFESYPLI